MSFLSDIVRDARHLSAREEVAASPREEVAAVAWPAPTVEGESSSGPEVSRGERAAREPSPVAGRERPEPAAPDSGPAPAPREVTSVGNVGGSRSATEASEGRELSSAPPAARSEVVRRTPAAPEVTATPTPPPPPIATPGVTPGTRASSSRRPAARRPAEVSAALPRPDTRDGGQGRAGVLPDEQVEVPGAPGDEAVQPSAAPAAGPPAAGPLAVVAPTAAKEPPDFVAVTPEVFVSAAETTPRADGDTLGSPPIAAETSAPLEGDPIPAQPRHRLPGNSLLEVEAVAVRARPARARGGDATPPEASPRPSADSSARPIGEEPQVDATSRASVEGPARAPRALGRQTPPAATPRVHIGQVEVVIVAPPPQQRPAKPAVRGRADASRLYLRSL
jgi:hypothetical protein